MYTITFAENRFVISQFNKAVKIFFIWFDPIFNYTFIKLIITRPNQNQLLSSHH